MQRVSSIIGDAGPGRGRPRITGGATTNDPGPPSQEDREGQIRLIRPPGIPLEEQYAVLSEDEDEAPLPRGWTASTAMVPARAPYLDRKAGPLATLAPIPLFP